MANSISESGDQLPAFVGQSDSSADRSAIRPGHTDTNSSVPTPNSVQRISGFPSDGRSDPADPTSVGPEVRPTVVDVSKPDASSIYDRHLRQIGAELHDGPAQLLGLALLHLDGAIPTDPDDRVARAAERTREAITSALREIRDMAGGLVLPELDGRSVVATVRLAVETYERRTGATVSVRDAGQLPGFRPSKALNVCLYRFAQEGLINGLSMLGALRKRSRSARSRAAPIAARARRATGR